MKKIKIFEWFGGIGAATQAFKRQFGKENIEVLDYVELDKHAVASYNAMNETNFKPTDINDIDVSKYEEADLLIAGWPCQDYSIAGRGLGLDGTRSSLILLTISKIKEMTNKPKHILLENVKGLLSKKHKEDLEYIRELFEELGYNWNQAMLNSKYFGVPQARERVFMLLTRNDLEMKRIDHLEKINTVDKVLADILDLSEPTQTITLKECLENKNVIIKDGKPVYVMSDNSTRSLFEIKGINKTINIPHSNNYTNNVLGTQKGQMPTIMAGTTRFIYLRNELPQYNGKTIQVDMDKLYNQKREEINKIGTLGTLTETPEKYFKQDNQKIIPVNDGGLKLVEIGYVNSKQIAGIGGVFGTISARSASDNRTILFTKNTFKDIAFDQDKSFHGINGQSRTITTGRTTFQPKIVLVDETAIHYRKLSTLECWRLMGFSDDAHEKVKLVTTKTKAGKEKRVISDSQMAKQAGNSIVVDVLVAIFKEIFNG